MTASSRSSLVLRINPKTLQHWNLAQCPNLRGLNTIMMKSLPDIRASALHLRCASLYIVNLAGRRLATPMTACTSLAASTCSLLKAGNRRPRKNAWRSSSPFGIRRRPMKMAVDALSGVQISGQQKLNRRSSETHGTRRGKLLL